ITAGQRLPRWQIWKTCYSQKLLECRAHLLPIARNPILLVISRPCQKHTCACGLKKPLYARETAFFRRFSQYLSPKRGKTVLTETMCGYRLKYLGRRRLPRPSYIPADFSNRVPTERFRTIYRGWPWAFSAPRL